MAISAKTVWEVRATGAYDNGGGFDSSYGGSDYSQQASPQLTVTDGTSNTGTAVLTSVTGGFTSAMLGNVLTFSQGGTFHGFWQIIGFTSSNSVTLDRNSPVTAANSTIKVGGANKFDQNGFTPQSINTTSAVVPGQHLWVKAGAYTPSVNDVSFGDSSCNGTASNPITVEGYNTTRGDIMLDPSLARPTITPSGGAQVPLNFAGSHWIVRALETSSANTIAAAVQFGSGSSDCILENCVANAGASTKGINMLGTRNTTRNNWVKAGATASDGIVVAGTAPHTVEYNRIQCTFGNSFSGIYAPSGGNIHHNIISGFSFGVLLQGGTAVHVTLENNNLYHNVNGLYFNDAAQGPMTARVHNNIFVSNTTYQVRHATADYTANAGNVSAMECQFDCNFFYDNGATRYSRLNTGSNDVTLTADPFTDAAGGDFSLNDAAGGGDLVRTTPCAVTWADGINSTRLYAGAAGASAGSTGMTSMRSLWRELTGEKNETTHPDSVVDLYLQAGLEALNRRVGYHLTTDTTTIALVDGTEEYTLPTDCVEVVFVEHNGQLLDKTSIDEWRRQGINWRTATKGKSAEWAMYANKLVLSPRPNAAMVAEASACTLRYISTPPSITDSGPEQLITQDYRVIVYYAVAEYSRSYPDSAFAVKRADDYQAKFEAEAAGIAQNYASRGVAR